jgi:radical SAM protein with 4Fe4S-binding SPASM domain
MSHEVAVTETTKLAVLGGVQTWAHDRHVPLNVMIELTQRCNIRCQHCYNFDRDLPRRDSSCATGQPELSRDELLGLISTVHAAGCLFLNFTGGEALLHPDLFALMDHATSLNMAIGLLTNGVLLRPGLVAGLARYRNLTRVGISLYGASAAVHDQITQAPGSFERTWAGIRRLRDKNIPVFLKFIVMRGNAHQVEAMAAQAKQVELPHGFDTTITARHDGTRGSLATRIDQQQLEDLCGGPLRHQLRTGPERTFTDEQFACNCARGNCAITAQGDVQPCMSVPMVAGNIRQQPFADIWRSSPLFQWIRGLRIADYAACAPCAHKSWCTRERGAAYTYSGSYTGTDPLVCAKAEISHRLALESPK